MKIVYKDRKTENICTNLKIATKVLNKDIAEKLKATINLIEMSKNFRDIIFYPPFHFHNLKGKLKDKFAIDVGGRKSGYRITLELLDGNSQRFEVCDIDKIVDSVEIILILEVSNHYE